MQANPAGVATDENSGYHSCHRPTAGFTSFLPQGFAFSDASLLSPSFSFPRIPLESRNCINSQLRPLCLLKCKMSPHLAPTAVHALRDCLPSCALAFHQSDLRHLPWLQCTHPRGECVAARRAHREQGPLELLGGLDKAFFSITGLSL